MTLIEQVQSHLRGDGAPVNLVSVGDNAATCIAGGGKAGGDCISIAGVTSSIDFEPALDAAFTGNNRTFACWIYVPTAASFVGADYALIMPSSSGIGNSAKVAIVNNGGLTQIDWTLLSPLGASFTRDVWHHVSLAWNATQAWFWLDGALDGRCPYGFSHGTPALPTKLMRAIGSGHTLKFTQVAIWNSTLSDANVIAIYNAGNGVARGSYPVAPDYFWESCETPIDVTVSSACLPVSPEELRGLVPTADDDVCNVLRKASLFDIKVWQNLKWMFNEDGSLTDDFKRQICAAKNGTDCNAGDCS